MNTYYQLQIRTIHDVGIERCLPLREWIEDAKPLIFPFSTYEEAEAGYDDAMKTYLESKDTLDQFPLPEGAELKWRMTGAEFNPEDEGGFWFVIYWQPTPKKFIELAEGRILIRKAKTPEEVVKETPKPANRLRRNK